MRKLALLAAAAICLASAAAVSAHPDEKGELYIPWLDQVDSKRLTRSFMSEGSQFRTNAAPAAPGSSRMTLVGNADKDGTTNSDLAFNGKLAYAGNYDGFRILDISQDQPRTITDMTCRGPQNDVSFHKMGGKTFLFQSVDSGQTAEDCSSADSPIVDGGRVGYEGVRVFDVTNPRSPGVPGHDPDRVRLAHAHAGARRQAGGTSTSPPIRWPAASRRPARRDPATTAPARSRTRRSRSSRSARPAGSSSPRYARRS